MAPVSIMISSEHPSIVILTYHRTSTFDQVTMTHTLESLGDSLCTSVLPFTVVTTDINTGVIKSVSLQPGDKDNFVNELLAASNAAMPLRTSVDIALIG